MACLPFNQYLRTLTFWGMLPFKLDKLVGWAPPLRSFYTTTYMYVCKHLLPPLKKRYILAVKNLTKNDWRSCNFLHLKVHFFQELPDCGKERHAPPHPFMLHTSRVWRLFVMSDQPHKAIATPQAGPLYLYWALGLSDRENGHLKSSTLFHR